MTDGGAGKVAELQKLFQSSNAHVHLLVNASKNALHPHLRCSSCSSYAVGQTYTLQACNSSVTGMQLRLHP